MERNLKFLKTMSVAEFKAQHNVEKIEVCSAETGDIFLLLHQKGEGGATTLATL